MKRNLRWILPLALALLLRLALLGAQPLDDREAALAWQAWEIAHGGQPLLRPELTYLFPTAALFWLQLNGDWVARLWPALAGLSLVLVPWALRRELGERFAFWLALGLALDPFLTAASRRADGAILAAAALAWALTAVRKGRPGWAGAAFMLALMSGPGVWHLALGLLLTLLLLTSLSYEQVRMTWDMVRWLWPVRGRGVSRALSGAAAVLVLAALVRPAALTAWLKGLPNWLAGWNWATGLSPGFFLLGGLVYGFLPLGLGLLARWQDRRQQRRDFFAAALAIWGAMTAFVVVFYPAHHPTDFLWAVLPFWWLAAGLLAQAEPWLLTGGLPVWTAASVTAGMFAFLWLQMEAVLVRFGGFSQPVQLFAWTVNLSERGAQFLVWLVGWLILLVALALFASLWGAQAARRGFWQGAGVMAGLFTLALSWGATGVRVPAGFEFWQAEGKVVGARVLQATVDDFSTWNGNDPGSLDVVLLGSDLPSVRWALRDYHPSAAAGLAADRSPSLVLTTSTADFVAGQEYRGQLLVWQKRPLWQLGADWNAWGRWIMLRQAPSVDEKLILWVRMDLFPDGRTQP